MTINSDLSRARYVGNGVTATFSIPFPYLTNNDGTAQVAVHIGDSDIPLIEGKDYTVKGFGKYSDTETDEDLLSYETRYERGEFTLAEAPDLGKPVAVIRSIPQTQGVVFVEGEKFPAQDFENALDKLTMEVQELKENLERAVMFPPASDIDPFHAREEIMESALEAKNAAVEAKKSENIAKASMDEAIGAAENAIASESLAKASADEAKQSENTAKASMDGATIAAAAALESESIAKASAEEAKQYNEEIKTIIDNYATKEELSQEVDDINLALANVYTKEEVDHAIASAQPDMSADKVEYINGSITTVQQALDQLLYVMPSITSFSGGGTYEVGQSIASVNFAWTLNKAVTTQSINQGIGSLDPSVRSYNYTPSTPIRTNITYTLSVSDGKNTATRSTSLAFRYKRYWGVSSKDTLTNADILALSKELTTGRTQSRTFNCSGGKYFYFVIPTEYCSGISFKVGGLAFSDMQSSDITLTNESGASVACRVYRSKNLQTGSAISVEVL